MNKIFVAVLLALLIIGLYLQFFSDIKQTDTELLSQYEQMR